MRIQICGLEFAYSSVPVLKDVTMDLSGPQLVSIIGPNGVGKSTLIHCIDRILEPTAGVVAVNSVDVDAIDMKELAKTVGYVPYSSSDAFPLSVVDTVLMGRHPHSGWKSLDHDLDIVYSVLDLLNIRDLAMRDFDELSAGQHQKVMIARGLVQEPQVLLLDEPTANLDIKHQMEVTRILRKLAVERGILVVMISHDLNIAAKYSDNVLMLYGGSIFAVGSPSEVLTKENIKAVYDVDCEVVSDHGRPHLIMQDPEFDGCADDAGSTTYARANADVGPLELDAPSDDGPGRAGRRKVRGRFPRSRRMRSRTRAHPSRGQNHPFMYPTRYSPSWASQSDRTPCATSLRWPRHGTASWRTAWPFRRSRQSLPGGRRSTSAHSRPVPSRRSTAGWRGCTRYAPTTSAAAGTSPTRATRSIRNAAAAASEGPWCRTRWSARRTWASASCSSTRL